MEKREKGLPDVASINPRYRGAKMSDVARALVTDPKVRERLAERWAETTRVPDHDEQRSTTRRPK